MQAVARNFLNILLFIVLLLISVIFVHTYPYPMPLNQLKYWVYISDLLDIANPENVYFPTMWFVDIMVAIIVYKMIFFVRKKLKNPG